MSVNYSNTFFVRSVCKFCKGGPKYHYKIINSAFKNTPDIYIDSMRKNSRNLTVKNHKVYYDHMNIRKWNFLKDNSINLFFRKHPLSLRKEKGKSDLFLNVLVCPCDRTHWSFLNSVFSVSKNKKSRYYFKIK